MGHKWPVPGHKKGGERGYSQVKALDSIIAPFLRISAPSPAAFASLLRTDFFVPHLCPTCAPESVLVSIFACIVCPIAPRAPLDFDDSPLNCVEPWSRNNTAGKCNFGLVGIPAGFYGQKQFSFCEFFGHVLERESAAKFLFE